MVPRWSDSPFYRSHLVSVTQEYYFFIGLAVLPENRILILEIPIFK